MTDTKSEQATAGSRLSVDAKVFVPVSPEKQEGPPPCANGIPEYMTNCYPFVQGDPNTFMPNGVRWPQPQNPQGGRGRGRGGNRNPSAAHFTGYTTPYGNFPTAPFNMTSVIVPAAPYQPIMEPQFPVAMPGMPIRQPMPFANAQGVFNGGQAFLAALGQGNSLPTTKRGRKKAKRGGRSRSNSRAGNPGQQITSEQDNPGKVSVGVQNEAVGGGKKKQKKRIIILLDIAIQTDFNEDLANLTLAELPNSLYLKSKHRMVNKASNMPAHTPSDSEEEVDSDSGYSSPLHRRNLTSCGTHPVNSVLNNVPSTDTNLAKQGALAVMPDVATKNYQVRKLLEIPTVLPSGGNTIHYVNPVLSLVPAGVNIQNFVNPVPGGAEAYAKMSYANVAKAPPMVRPDVALLAGNNAMLAGHLSDGAGMEVDNSGKKKRRRRRRRGGKRKILRELGDKNEENDDENAVSGSKSDDPEQSTLRRSGSHASFDALINDEMAPLHFEDETEFPGLGPAAGSAPLQALTYSDILKSTGTGRPYGPGGPQNAWQPDNEELKTLKWCSPFADAAAAGDDLGSDDSADGGKTAKENKIARKRRKRREMANMAAERELMEISLEQQFLKEIGPKATKPTPPQNSGKKSKQPMSLNIAEMITALENSKPKKAEPAKDVPAPKKPATEYETILNVLDSSGPQKKRGKEREVPKVKKPSTLKKVILKEREEKKKARLFEEGDVVNPEYSGISVEEDLSQEGMSSKMSDIYTTASNDMSPISQTSPISMSPLSPGSPFSSGVNSPIAGSLNKSPAALKLHSRRFREYCNQVIDKDIDECCTLLLQDLVRFQDRLYHKDPVKAKMKRRIVLGLREVTKHLKLNKIKIVIISPNMERVKAKGGLDDALNNILHMCTEQDVPFVFALGRRALGRACAKLVPVSVAGVFNYEGCEENFNKLMELSQHARHQYAKMVKEMEAEEIQHMKTLCSQPVFAHMGHSRTPSGCSAISFASSLLSEPISENDNDYDVRKVDDKSPNLLVPKDRRQYLSHSRNSSLGKVSIVESIDEGNEADTEEFSDALLKHMSIILDKEDPLNSKIDTKIDPVNSGKMNGLNSSGGADTLKAVEINGIGDDFEDNDNDTVEELPHIDSIHNICMLDTSVEMLSQHSEVLSTHSSKTLGAATPIKGSMTPDGPHSDQEVTPHSLSQRIKSLDKERIESWVEEAKSCMQELKISESEGELTLGEGTDVDL